MQCHARMVSFNTYFYTASSRKQKKILLNSFYEMCITLTPKAHKDSTMKDNCRPIALVHINVLRKNSARKNYHISFPCFYSMPCFKECKLYISFGSQPKGRSQAPSHLIRESGLFRAFCIALCWLCTEEEARANYAHSSSMCTNSAFASSLFHSFPLHLFHQSYCASLCKTFRSTQDVN